MLMIQLDSRHRANVGSLLSYGVFKGRRRIEAGICGCAMQAILQERKGEFTFMLPGPGFQMLIRSAVLSSNGLSSMTMEILRGP